MRKLQNIILTAVAVMILFVIPAHAEKTSYNVGIINNFALTEDDISPYATDCLKTLFEYTDDAELNCTAYKTDPGIEALNSSSLNFIIMIPRTDELADKVDFTSLPIATGFLSLFVDNDTDLYFNDYLNFNGMRVAMLQNSPYENVLSSYAATNNFTYTPVYYSDIYSMQDALTKGEADALLSPHAMLAKNMRIIAKCGRCNYYCAVKKGDTKMLNTLNTLLRNVEDNDPFYIANNYLRVFEHPYGNAASMTKNDFEAAKNKKALRVFVPDNYPMSFYDKTSRSYSGLYIDIVNQIAANAGLGVEYIYTDINNSDKLTENLVLGKADAVLTVSAPMQGIVDVTDPYTTLDFYPVGKKDIDEKDDLHIGMIKDNTWVSAYIKETHPSWTVSMYDSIHSAFNAAEQGKIDAALISLPDLQTKTSLVAHPHLSIRQEFSLNIPVRLGISRITCTTQIVSMLNGIIRNVSTDGAALENKMYTLSNTYIPTFHDMLYANRLWVIIILIAVGIIMLLLAWRIQRLLMKARIDPLTNIYNWEYFFKACGKISKKNPSKVYLLASVDAINFKLVNNRFGTTVGDQTLQTIALEIKKLFKNRALYGRFEGDNFLVLIEDSPENRKIIDELNNIDVRIHNSTNYRVHLKTGICPISGYDPRTSLTIYIDRANIAKEGEDSIGRSFICYFTDEMHAKLETESELEVDMISALQKGEFIAYYQPKYDLKSNQIIGAEALVRWQHKTKGLIAPGVFVPLFERNGFINEVDFCVYEQVLRMLKKRMMQGKQLLTVSVNVSRCHLTDPDFADKFENLVNKYEIPKEYIDIEITESIFSEGDSSANRLVYEMKKRGFSVSMDDFGTGYSSLNLLREMPIDTLKIDKAFIDDIETSIRSLCIIEEIIAMANRIDIKTICEGIETKGQRDIIRNAGCNTAQGFYYSRPIPEQSFENLLDGEN